jgi:hypothetical protein
MTVISAQANSSNVHNIFLSEIYMAFVFSSLHIVRQMSIVFKTLLWWPSIWWPSIATKFFIYFLYFTHVTTVILILIKILYNITSDKTYNSSLNN